jgi:hypothetical protein
MHGRILDHQERVARRDESRGDLRLIEAVGSHVERHIGPVAHVIHQLSSDVVHVDLFWVLHGPRREFHTFITCGMSERPMKAPDGYEGCRYAELVLRLPTHWRLDFENPGDDLDDWPLQELVALARMPHLYRTWLWAGHTVANGNPPQPLCPSTRFAGTILDGTIWTPPDFQHLVVDPDRTLHFLSVIPLYPDELQFARQAGSSMLLQMMDLTGVDDLLNPNRADLFSATN